MLPANENDEAVSLSVVAGGGDEISGRRRGESKAEVNQREQTTSGQLDFTSRIFAYSSLLLVTSTSTAIAKSS